VGGLIFHSSHAVKEAKRAIAHQSPMGFSLMPDVKASAGTLPLVKASGCDKHGLDNSATPGRRSTMSRS